MKLLKLKTVLSQMALVVVLACSFSALQGLLLSPSASALSKENGKRLLEEYKSRCSYFDPGSGPARNTQDKRCQNVRKALVDNADCNFGSGRATEIQKNRCGDKVNALQSSGSGGAASNPGEGDDEAAADPALSCDVNTNCNLYEKYINPIINLLAAFVAIAVTIGIVSGGIRYASAADDPQKMGAAKKQIQGAIIALLVFIFLYAAIQWLVPAA